MLDDSVHGYFVWIGFLKWVVFDWLCMCCFCLNLAVPFLLYFMILVASLL